MRAAAAIVALWLVGCAARPTAVRAPVAHEFEVDAGDVHLMARSIGGGDESATTMIALHGGPGAGSNYLFEALKPIASPSLRVVIYDQRGAPGFEKARRGERLPSSAYAPAKYAADLAAVMDAAGVRRAHLISHSWGGIVAHAFAQEHPERIASLIFVDAVPPTWVALQRGGKARAENLKRLQSEGVMPARVPEAAENCGESRRLAALQLLADPAHPPPQLQGVAERSDCSSTSAAALAHSQSAGYDYRAALGKIAVPALVIMGAHDPLDAGWADETESALSRARVQRVTIARSGHYPFWEQPEAFYAALRAFLQDSK